MNIAIGCDPNAMDAKNKIVELLHSLGHSVVDFGSDDPIYANTAIAVGEFVAAQKAERGILMCGTGLGVCIAANKVRGVYAALISDIYSAERSIKSNNCNVACFGAFTMGGMLIESLVKAWLSYSYTRGTPSEPKVLKLVEYDNKRK